SPVFAAWKFGDGHDFDCGHPQVPQMIELLDGCSKGAFASKSADVELINNRLLPRPVVPPGIIPGPCRWIDDFARPMYVFRLIAGGGIGDTHTVRQNETVTRSRGGALRRQFVPTAGLGEHRDGARFAHQFDLDSLYRRRPQPEPDRSIRTYLGPMRIFGGASRAAAMRDHGWVHCASRANNKRDRPVTV